MERLRTVDSLRLVGKRFAAKIYRFSIPLLKICLHAEEGASQWERLVVVEKLFEQCANQHTQHVGLVGQISGSRTVANRLNGHRWYRAK